ncbi:MAG: hypothetical protein JXQ72_00105 [Anaerolineae bacterium]|nr:hypothetical protein [Anaerolineae bacterium]
MAKLPNGDQAVVPLEKFTEYALNPAHPTGRYKARVFNAVLGLMLGDAAFLQETVQRIAETEDAVPQEPTQYGQRYVIDFELTTDSGRAIVRTAWMIRKTEEVPRLTSCYVIEDVSE